MAKAPADIRSLARQHTESALRTLVSIMNDEKAPVPARVNAAGYLLDRGWGKAHQSIEISGEVTNKVIRAPAVAGTMAEWAANAPNQVHTEH